MNEAIPAFVAMITIPLTFSITSFSITSGIAFGSLALIVVKLSAGKSREIKPAMWAVAALSVLLLWTGH